MRYRSFDDLPMNRRRGRSQVGGLDDASVHDDSTHEGLKAQHRTTKREVADLKRKWQLELEEVLTLDDLGDVDTTSTEPVDGYALVYDEAAGLWLPGAVAGGGVPTLLVAAHNATARTKDMADYVCDGTADEVEINQAISAISGADPYMGRVVLSEGEFYTTGVITLGWRTLFEGFGEATVIYPAGGITGVANDEESTLRGVTIVGDGTAGSKGVVAVGVRSLVESCSVSGSQVGIEVQSASGPVSILNCRLGATTASSPYSIDVLATANDLLIQGCVMAHSLRMASNYTMTLGNRFAVGCTITVSSGNGNCFSDNLLPAGLANFSDSGTQTQRGTNFSQSVTW